MKQSTCILVTLAATFAVGCGQDARQGEPTRASNEPLLGANLAETEAKRAAPAMSQEEEEPLTERLLAQADRCY